MNAILFYDTETQGLPLRNQPETHPGQPHIVQLGAMLVEIATRKTIATLDVIVRPEGWTIPDEVAQIHGITSERAAAVGVPEALAVELLLELQRAASFRVAHNAPFDDRIVRIACARFFDPASMEQWNAGAVRCTAEMSTPILRLPPTERMLAAGRDHFKMPNLGEAYHFVTGRVLEGAHSAIVDVEACRDVFFGLSAERAEA